MCRLSAGGKTISFEFMLGSSALTYFQDHILGKPSDDMEMYNAIKKRFYTSERNWVLLQEWNWFSFATVRQSCPDRSISQQPEVLGEEVAELNALLPASYRDETC